MVDGQVVFKDELKLGAVAGNGFDLNVVYGDTDSVFVRLQPHIDQVSLEDAGLIGKKIAEMVTSSLPQPMELVFEAFARRGLFLAKKRYALWVFEQIGEVWQDRIKVRGMETVRRDWCGLTSGTLKKCLDLVLKEGKVDEAVEHVRSWRPAAGSDLSGTWDTEELTLTRRYNKSTGLHKNKQPHISLWKMEKAGDGCPM